MLPNDTDSTIFREDGDIESMFFAFIDDHPATLLAVFLFLLF
jgi:hypothetical protein